MPRPPSSRQEKLLGEADGEAEGVEQKEFECKDHPVVASVFCVLFIAAFVWGVYVAVTMKTPP